MMLKDNQNFCRVSIKRATERKSDMSKERKIENSFKRETGILPNWAEICVSND